MNKDFIDEISKINNTILRCNVSLKNYNTMKLNGYARYFVMPTSFMELKHVLILIRKFRIKYFVIGNGSNIIFTSKEKECIIKLNFKKSKYDNILFSSDLLMVKGNEFYNKGYKGLEYISNIPASVGGAIYMNAGAYNHYFSDIIEYVYYLDENLNFKVINKDNYYFLNRKSIFKNSKNIILGCKVSLIKENKEHLKEIMDYCSDKRRKTQPLDYPNSGSIFKNVNDTSAWKLIESVSLKGYKKNGAMISDKHCNFIINVNDAKGEDVIYLINLIKKEIKGTFGVSLEEEIVIVD